MNGRQWVKDHLFKGRPDGGDQAAGSVAEVLRILNATPGVRAAEPMPAAEIERLLEPWLGAAASLSDLPVPALISVTLDAAAPPDLNSLSRRIAEAAPGAELNRHVVVVGFEEVGQLICLMLDKANIPYVAVDQDIGGVRKGRQLGNKVYFGDMQDTTASPAGDREALDSGDIIGGRYLAVGSIELDYLAFGNFGAAIFVDTGNADNDFLPSLKTGAGVGLRWRSPVGMLRLDVAHPFDDKHEDFRIHVSIGPEL